MNIKDKKTKKQVDKQNSSINVLSNEETQNKIEEIEKNPEASTWRKLDTRGKITFISDDMLIGGCDIGSETNYIRAIDTRD